MKKNKIQEQLEGNETESGMLRDADENEITVQYKLGLAGTFPLANRSLQPCLSQTNSQLPTSMSRESGFLYVSTSMYPCKMVK